MRGGRSDGEFWPLGGGREDGAGRPHREERDGLRLWRRRSVKAARASAVVAVCCPGRGRGAGALCLRGRPLLFLLLHPADEALEGVLVLRGILVVPPTLPRHQRRTRRVQCCCRRRRRGSMHTRTLRWSCWGGAAWWRPGQSDRLANVGGAAGVLVAGRARRLLQVRQMVRRPRAPRLRHRSPDSKHLLSNAEDHVLRLHVAAEQPCDLSPRGEFAEATSVHDFDWYPWVREDGTCALAPPYPQRRARTALSRAAATARCTCGTCRAARYARPHVC